MEQSPSWESHSSSASQENYILWNLMLHDHVCKSLTLVPILSQMHPHPPVSFKIHFGFFPSITRVPEMVSCQIFPPKFCWHLLLSCVCMPHPSQLWFHCPNDICEEYKSWSSLYSFLLPSLTFTILGPNLAHHPKCERPSYTPHKQR